MTGESLTVILSCDAPRGCTTQLVLDVDREVTELADVAVGLRVLDAAGWALVGDLRLCPACYRDALTYPPAGCNIMDLVNAASRRRALQSIPVETRGAS